MPKVHAETGKKGTGTSSHKISKVTSALIAAIIVAAVILAGFSYSTGFFGLIKKNNSIIEDCNVYLIHSIGDNVENNIQGSGRGGIGVHVWV